MAQVCIVLPSVLAQIVGNVTEVRVEGATIAEALEALFAEHPELRLHVFSESGRFREHVLCFHNEVNTRWLGDLTREVESGDRLTIMQAVSGG